MSGNYSTYEQKSRLINELVAAGKASDGQRDFLHGMSIEQLRVYDAHAHVLYSFRPGVSLTGTSGVATWKGMTANELAKADAWTLTELSEEDPSLFAQVHEIRRAAMLAQAADSR